MHPTVNSVFKNEASVAFSDMVKFILIQNELPTQEKNKSKLDTLARLTLSRMLSKIDQFYRDPETTVYGTDYNWNVVVG